MSEMVCRDCGTTGEPEAVTEGSHGVELVLWLCFLVPGFLYSIWRLSSRHDACACCGSVALVPPNSPVGRTLVQQYPTATPAAPARSSNAGATGRALGRAFRRYILRK